MYGNITQKGTLSFGDLHFAATILLSNNFIDLQNYNICLICKHVYDLSMKGSPVFELKKHKKCIMLALILYIVHEVLVFPVYPLVRKHYFAGHTHSMSLKTVQFDSRSRLLK